MGSQQTRFAKQIKEYKSQNLQYATCTMQGWRPTLQDTHLAISPFYITKQNKEISMFAVFDGHGGQQIANFVQKQFPKQLLQNQNFIGENYQLALKESLMKMDQLLKLKYEKSLSEKAIKQYKLKLKSQYKNKEKSLKKYKKNRVEKSYLSKKKIYSKKQNLDPQKQQETESSLEHSQNIQQQCDIIEEISQEYESSSPTKSRKQTSLQDYNFTLNDNCGCTAIVCLITNQNVYTANIGDSRAVACIKQSYIDQNKSSINNQENIVFSFKQKQLSFDHKPDNQKEKQRIENAGGKVQNNRINGQLNLSRAIGDLKYKKKSFLKPEQQIISSQPDIIKIPNQNIDYIIIGCDGIWQIKTANDMIQWINQKLDEKIFLNSQFKNSKSIKNKISTNQMIGLGSILQDIFDQLVAKDKKQETGKDNMSAILIKIQDRRSQWFKNHNKIINQELT